MNFWFINFLKVEPLFYKYANLIRSDIYISDMICIIWTSVYLDMKFWYVTWTCKLNIDLFSMKPGLSLGMGVPCPCHWCTDGMTHVWVSDFSHRPLSVICYGHYYYDLSSGAYGCILDLICLVDLTIIWLSVSVSGDWSLCAIHSFHISGS